MEDGFCVDWFGREVACVSGEGLDGIMIFDFGLWTVGMTLSVVAGNIRNDAISTDFELWPI
jgi:hypothetical protein